jgi:hypothetical protein
MTILERNTISSPVIVYSRTTLNIIVEKLVPRVFIGDIQVVRRLLLVFYKDPAGPMKLIAF